MDDCITKILTREITTNCVQNPDSSAGVFVELLACSKIPVIDLVHFGVFACSSVSSFPRSLYQGMDAHGEI